MLTSRESLSFWPAYQERWAGLLCDKTDGLQNWIDEMASVLTLGKTDVRNVAEARAALDTLSARLKRVESLKSNGFDHNAIGPDLLNHFVGYGAAILGAPPANSKRALTLRYGEVRGILEQLKSWISIMELSPSVVLGLADRDSQILGRALALRLKMRYETASGDMVSQSEAVVVAADSRSILSPALTTIFPEQVLFSFNLNPLGAALAPDVAGLACHELIFPWQVEAEEQGGETEDEAELPQREASSVAAQVAATRAVNDPGWPARLEFYRVRNTLLAAGNPRLSRLPMLPGAL